MPFTLEVHRLQIYIIFDQLAPCEKFLFCIAFTLLLFENILEIAKSMYISPQNKFKN